MSRAGGEQNARDLASANMVIKQSIMGYLTDEQKQARNRHGMNSTLFGNHLTDAQEEQEMSAIARSTRTAYKEQLYQVSMVIEQCQLLLFKTMSSITRNLLSYCKGGWKKDFHIYANRANRNG